MLEISTRKGMYQEGWPTAEASAGNGYEKKEGIITLNRNATNYYYVPFARNGINYAVANNEDVISYNFTGCIMAAYTNGSGERRVCHVSTGTNQDCKARWNTIKAGSSNVVEFKPSDAITVPPKHGGGWGCYGLITSDNKCYSITVVRPHGSRLWIVAHQQQLAL